jgi:hypothetical protein
MPVDAPTSSGRAHPQHVSQVVAAGLERGRIRLGEQPAGRVRPEEQDIGRPGGVDGRGQALQVPEQPGRVDELDEVVRGPDLVGGLVGGGGGRGDQ